MGRKHLFGRSKVQCKHSILPSTPHSTPHTFALALFSRASAQSTTHSLHSPQYMVVTAVTASAAFKQPRARWPPPRPSSSLRRPLRAAGCVKAPRHYLRPRCMIPRRDLGSSPKRADSSWTSPSSRSYYFTSGVLHPLAMLATSVCFR